MIPKFRAWHKKHKIMMSVQEIKWNEKGKIYWISGDKFFETEGDPHLEVDNIILMQSTGLKDKNGRGIFEGDIVSCFDETSVVEQFRGAFWLKPLNDNLETEGAWIIPNDEAYEVIGNIHENTELLREAGT